MKDDGSDMSLTVFLGCVGRGKTTMYPLLAHAQPFPVYFCNVQSTWIISRQMFKVFGLLMCHLCTGLKTK